MALPGSNRRVAFTLYVILCHFMLFHVISIYQSIY